MVPKSRPSVVMILVPLSTLLRSSTRLIAGTCVAFTIAVFEGTMIASGPIVCTFSSGNTCVLLNQPPSSTRKPSS